VHLLYCYLHHPKNNLTFTNIGEYKEYFKKDGNHSIYIEGYKAQFDSNGTIYFYDYGSNTPLDVTGELKPQTIKGASFYEISVPDSLKCCVSSDANSTSDSSESGGRWDYSEILVEIDGKLRQGVWEKSTGWWIEKYFNKPAMDDIQNALEDGLKNSN
jgi:hypothetical protein